MPIADQNQFLKKLYNACDPYRPASESQYKDLTESRGSGSFVTEYRRRLELADDYLSTLFAGHIGSGKSSELLDLVRNLKENKPRFFPVCINANDFLDDYDVDTPDLLLAIVTEVADRLNKDLKIKLQDNYFTRRFNELKSFLLSDVEINQGEIPLWDAKVKVERIKRDPTAREHVREHLRPKLSTLLEEMNTLFGTIRKKLRKHGQQYPDEQYEDLVCIVDNLEKIRQIRGKEEGLESQRELFVERYTQLTGMHAHFVWTVPLRLLRSVDGPQLAHRYDSDPYVLPMVKVCKRNGEPYEEGLEQLKSLLQDRIETISEGVELDEVIAEDALNFLLKYSGGHVRSLMIFLQESCTYAQQLPLDRKVAERAVVQSVRTYSTSIPEAHWKKLAELDLSDDHLILGGDRDYLSMLENLSVLEYVNGDGEDLFQSAEPWYAVNPIVRELRKFKEARERLQQPRTPEAE